MGVFIDGLASIDPNSMLLDNLKMVGQSNVSVIIGDEPEPNEPDLPTVIGSPMSVNFVTVINNDHQISVIYDSNGEVLEKIKSNNGLRTYVKYEDIDEDLKK